MSLVDEKISQAEYTGKDVASLPDKPSEAGISAAQLKAAFDRLTKDVTAIHFNAVIDILTGTEGASNIGTLDGSKNVQDVLDEVNAQVSAHENRRDNPHNVTKTQVGLSNVDNTSDIDKPVSRAAASRINVVEQTANTAVQNAGFAKETAEDALSFSVQALSTARQAEALAQSVYYQYDPTDGQRKPLQEVLYSLFNAISISSITCAEFDALGITATAFDLKNITAYEFDTRSKQILGA